MNTKMVPLTFCLPRGSLLFPSSVKYLQERNERLPPSLYWYRHVFFFAHGVRCTKHNQKRQLNVHEELL